MSDDQQDVGRMVGEVSALCIKAAMEQVRERTNELAKQGRLEPGCELARIEFPKWPLPRAYWDREWERWKASPADIPEGTSKARYVEFHKKIFACMLDGKPFVLTASQRLCDDVRRQQRRRLRAKVEGMARRVG